MMFTENKSTAQKINIEHWHLAGYSGKGVRVAIIDPTPKLYSYQKGIIKQPIPVSEYTEPGHGGQCCAVIQEMAPNAELFLLPDTLEAWNWILNNNINLVNCSYTGRPIKSTIIQALKASNIIVVCSAGNEGWETADGTYPAAYDFTVSVGAIYQSGLKAHYSATGETLDCLAYTDITIKTDSGTMQFNGTSCSCPVVVSMLALILERIGAKNWEWAKNFISLNCLDYGVAGKDTDSGYGVFTLPYLEGCDNMIIKLQVGSNLAYINGEGVTLNTAPKIENGSTLVPIRFISEAFDCKVDFNNETKEITITK